MNDADTFNVNASGAKLDEDCGCLEDNIISLIITNISRVFRDRLRAKTSEIDSTISSELSNEKHVSIFNRLPPKPEG